MTKFKVTWSTGGFEIFEAKSFKSAAAYVEMNVKRYFRNFRSLEIVADEA